MRKRTSVLASTFLVAFACLSGHDAAAAELTVADVESWLEGYKVAWETRDPDKAAALFTEDARYRETPFDEPLAGREGVREYWAEVTADQQDVTFTYEVLAVTGDTGIARWRSQFTSSSSGDRLTLDGVFVLEFADAAHCRRLDEWWHLNVVPAGEQ